jgi:uncharacterized protein YceK
MITVESHVRTNCILILIVSVFCSGCGTVSTGLNRNPYPVYGGIREDAHAISGGGSGVVLIIDVPFSFAADTLLLPLGLYDLRYLPPSVDPLKDWNSWSPRDEQSRSIKDDYRSYFNKHEPGYFEDTASYYENTAGQHAVRIRVGRNGYYTVYIFEYDKDNVRTKIISYANGGYAS